MADQINLNPHALALASDGAAPEWVQLTPKGPSAPAVDGRSWRLSNPDGVLAAFIENASPLPIDVEHATQKRGAIGLEAPAYGWIKALENRDGEIWGQVEWTDQGADWVKSKAYRFISPSFKFDTATMEMTAITGAGLTNKPAFRMEALARSEDLLSQQENTAMLEELLKELGLASDASKDDAIGAISKLKTDVATASEALPDLSAYVPRTQYEATASELSVLKAAEVKREGEALASALEGAVASGKIKPAAKAQYQEIASKIGLASFEELVEGMSVDPLFQAPPKAKGGVDIASGKLGAEDLALARAMGKTAEEYAATKATEEGTAT